MADLTVVKMMDCDDESKNTRAHHRRRRTPAVQYNRRIVIISLRRLSYRTLSLAATEHDVSKLNRNGTLRRFTSISLTL